MTSPLSVAQNPLSRGTYLHFIQTLKYLPRRRIQERKKENTQERKQELTQENSHEKTQKIKSYKKARKKWRRRNERARKLVKNKPKRLTLCIRSYISFHKVRISGTNFLACFRACFLERFFLVRVFFYNFQFSFLLFFFFAVLAAAFICPILPFFLELSQLPPDLMPAEIRPQ